MAIYRFRSSEGIPVPPERPDTSIEIFRLLAIEDVEPTLLEQEAEPLDLTPPYSENLKYSLTVTDESSARLDIEPVSDCSNYVQCDDEPSADNPRSISIPSHEPFVSIIEDDPSGEPRLYEVIAILPPGIVK